MRTNTFIVAYEGWKSVAMAGGAAIFFMLLDWDFLTWIAIACFAFLAWVYRNPERIVPYFQQQSIVSTVDGTVTAIETVDSCEACDEPCYRIEIVSDYFDASILRAPFEANVTEVRNSEGSRLSRFNPLAKKLNATATVTFTTSRNDKAVCEHMLTQSIDAIHISPSSGHRIVQGARYGAMVKGVSTLYLNASSRLAVNVGDSVRAGETLIGYFPIKV